MTTWQMYWLVKLDDISTACCIIGVTGSLAAVIGLIAIAVNGVKGEGEAERGFEDRVPGALAKIIRRFAPVAFALLLTATLLPDTKQLAAIILVPKLVNSEVVQRDIPQVYDLAVEWMKAKLAVPEPVEQ